MIHADVSFRLEKGYVLNGAVNSGKVELKDNSSIIYGCDYQPPITLPEDICTATFVDGATSHNIDGKINLNDLATIFNNGDVALQSPAVNNVILGVPYNYDSCIAGPCEPSEPIKPTQALDFGDFLTTDSSIVYSGNGLIGENGDTEFSNVTIASGEVVSFNSLYNHYRIKNLNLQDSATIEFTSGDYWIESISSAENVKINVTTGVRIFIANDATFPIGSLLNDLGKSEDLFIYSYANITLEDISVYEPEKRIIVNAMILCRRKCESWLLYQSKRGCFSK